MSSENAGGNRRLFKNTLILYVRMAVTMGISCLTVRMLLDYLGVIDYGLISVIESIVSMCSLLTASLTNSSARFFAFELGREQNGVLGRIFSQMQLMYVCAIVLIVLVLETAGLWYFHERLVMPGDRREAAAFFYQASILITALTIFKTPYCALIVAHENMSAFSVITIVESVGRFLAAFGISLFSFDKFVVYGILLVGVNLLGALCYVVYCLRKYPESRPALFFSKRIFKMTFAFSGWAMFGNLAWSAQMVFLPLLLNSFFGPVVNAARGVALYLAHAIMLFSENFFRAGQPRIVKAWASRDKQAFSDTMKLVSKTGFLLLAIPTIPVMYELDGLLHLWLTNVPEHAKNFILLILLDSLVNVFAYPLVYAVQATGRIALFESLGSSIRILVFPLAWIALACGAPPEAAFVILIFITFATLLSRFLIFCRRTHTACGEFAWDVFGKMGLVFLLAQILPFLITEFFASSFSRMLFNGTSSVLWTTAFWYMLALTKEQKQQAHEFAERAVRRILKNMRRGSATI